MADYFDMSGKVVLLTGGSRGLGLEMAKGFASQGADLVIASRKIESCREATQEIERLGRRALPYACHVGQWNELDGLVRAAYEAFGRIDVLVNNAGIAPVAPSSAEVTEELFDKTVAVNFKGPFRLAALVASRMREGSGGSIINVSSTGAIRPKPAYIPYAGAKAALNTMTRGMALEFGPKVRVNAIMCGPFWTDISKSWREGADKNSPLAMGRIGRPEEIVTAALYLASDKSSFTTGSIVEVAGGLP